MKSLPFVSVLCLSIASALAADPLTISFEGKDGVRTRFQLATGVLRLDVPI